MLLQLAPLIVHRYSLNYKAMSYDEHHMNETAQEILLIYHVILSILYSEEYLL